MTLKARITEDMKTAMRAGDTARLSTIRLLLAAIKQREVDERIELDRRRRAGDHREDAQAAQRIDRAVRGRPAAPTWPTTSTSRSACCQAYLPQQLTDAEVDALIADAIADDRRRRPADMGKVMAVLKPQARRPRRHGRAFRRWSRPSSPADVDCPALTRDRRSAAVAASARPDNLVDRAIVAYNQARVARQPHPAWRPRPRVKSMIPNDFIQTLLARVDIVEVIDRTCR